ncbi:MAG: hypothetical protein ABSH05_24665 [Bryobacteraceae bacterium]|jgi:hypothetical protein
MNVTAMGRVNVATPGTLVPLSADPTLRVARLAIQSIPALTGKGYIGCSDMVRASLVGVIRILWPNASGGIADSLVLESQSGTNNIPLSEYYIDMDVAGEGLLVSYWTA